MANNSNKTRRIYVGLTQGQYTKIEGLYKKSNCHTLSEYVRKLLSDKPVTIFYRDQSLDDLIEEIAELNNEMNNVRNIAFQALEKLTQHQGINQHVTPASTLEIAVKNLYKRIEEIKNQIEKITDKWLQS